MDKRKDVSKKLKTCIDLVIEIKKKFKKNSSGLYKCICGEMASFTIVANNHLHLKCNHCKLMIME